MAFPVKQLQVAGLRLKLNGHKISKIVLNILSTTLKIVTAYIKI